MTTSRIEWDDNRSSPWIRSSASPPCVRAQTVVYSESPVRPGYGSYSSCSHITDARTMANVRPCLRAKSF
ncbi:hypothetical protein BDA96_08G021400 [Sorghum bicolor]|uniref:Uncharacterized protein n=1 Tax=Sorghum bicolor TaxID=4558 RepID=A0A921QF32_SORBI|nr:hypothetical protein BDA96_08G021400 [Sorghum bicolor]